MGVQTEISYAVTCDRCGQGGRQEKNPHEDDDNWQWWARRDGVTGHAWPSTQRMICRDCSEALEFWFEHCSTPAGRMYNSGLQEAFVRAKQYMSKPGGGRS